MAELTRTACPACSTRYRVPTAAVGHRVKCKSCGTTFRVQAKWRPPSEDDILRWLDEAAGRDERADAPAPQPRMASVTSNRDRATAETDASAPGFDNGTEATGYTGVPRPVERTNGTAKRPGDDSAVAVVRLCHNGEVRIPPDAQDPAGEVFRVSARTGAASATSNGSNGRAPTVPDDDFPAAETTDAASGADAAG